MKTSRILLVDDDPDSIRLIGSWLEACGASVRPATGPGEADVALAADTFDLIVSDIHMPGNNRLQWIERILRDESLPPVLLLTGNPELETTLRAANLPVAGYLLKPPDFSTLGALLQRLVSAHRRRMELRALSGEAAALLATAPAGVDNDPVRDRLRQLAQCLAAEAAHRPRETTAPEGADAPWRAVITETIAVLEKTKHSFRSKELGQLRRHLQQTLDLAPSAGRHLCACSSEAAAST